MFSTIRPRYEIDDEHEPFRTHDFHVLLTELLRRARAGIDPYQLEFHKDGYDDLFGGRFSIVDEASAGLPFPIYAEFPYPYEEELYAPDLVRLWNHVDLAAPPEVTMREVSDLLALASRAKEATVPPRAIFDIQIGPFDCVEVEEFPGAVNFRLRTRMVAATRERGILSLGLFLNTGEWRIPAEPLGFHFDDYEEVLVPASERVEESDPAYDRYVEHVARAIEAFSQRRLLAMQLLLSAILHDCWVVEQRESSFGSKRVPQRELWMPTEQDGRTLVYLPRVRYLRNDRVKDFREQLQRPELRAHLVREHKRQLAPNAAPSEAAKKLAAMYGFDLPERYTFVGRHERGKGNREILYRSRSALRLLFDYVEQPDARTPPKWFQFESDVRELLQQLGVDVRRWATSGKADDGIDIEGVLELEQGPIALLVQCKCWNRTRLVGPAVVRELAGAMAAFARQRPALTDRDIRGVVVTTSGFTRDAKQIADAMGILLVDGELLCAPADAVRAMLGR